MAYRINEDKCIACGTYETVCSIESITSVK